jgi:hypothetical protein
MKTTIDMAREAGFETMITKGKIHGLARDGDYTEELKAFEALVRADERTRLHPKKIKAAKDEYCHGDERYYAND